MNEILYSTKFLAILAALGGGLLSFFIGLLMERYKNRSLKIANSISFQKIGIPEDSYLPGDLHVTYNNEEVNSLYLFRLILKNSSNFDSKELPINFNCDLDSYILSYSFGYIPTTSHIEQSEIYNQKINNYLNSIKHISDENKNDLYTEPYLSQAKWIYNTRMLVASSLNRNEKIVINILVGSQIVNHVPYLHLKMPVSGIKLIEDLDPIKENERIGVISILIGLILTFTLGTYFYINNLSSSTAIIIISIVGALNVLIGILIYKAYKFIHSYFK